MIYYFHSTDLPLYVFAIYAKNVAVNLTMAQRNQLAKVVAEIKATFKKKMTK